MIEIENEYFGESQTPMLDGFLYHYRCEVLEIVDSMTIDVLVYLGFGITTQERVSLAGIHVPECFAYTTGEEKHFGRLTKRRLAGLLPVGTIVGLISKKFNRTGNNTRIFGEIVLKNGRKLGNQLLEEFLAIEYDDDMEPDDRSAAHRKNWNALIEMKAIGPYMADDLL